MFFCSNVSYQVQSTKSEAPQYKHRQVLIVGIDLVTEVRTEHHMGNGGPRSEKVGPEDFFGKLFGSVFLDQR